MAVEPEIIDAEVVDLEPLPQLPPAEGRCNARTRQRRGYCQRPGMANGRCKLHGGMTPFGAASANFKDGRTSKYQYLPPALTARVENLNQDAIDNLEQSLAIQRSLETELLEQLHTSNQASVREGLVHRIQSLHETQRKMTETLTKCRKEIQETYTQEQWNEMLSIVLELVRKYMLAEDLQKFARDLEERRTRVRAPLNP